MTSFWKTMTDVTKEKLDELGIAGSILGLIWIVGIWVWYDWSMGAYRENVTTAGNILLWTLIGWVLIGLVLYLWRDPHHVRETLFSRLQSD